MSSPHALTWARKLNDYDIPIQDLLAKYPSDEKLYLAAGTVVFSPTNKVLIVQRSLSDSRPGLWETPGGGCDADDVSVLYSAARELLEESGLVARRIIDVIGRPDYFTSTSGKRIMKLDFIVEAGSDVEEQVKLDPEEHQDFVWATEEEIQRGIASDRSLSFTSQEQLQVILDAFEMRRNHANSS